jgi:predicted O-methyltransferase YrrM
LIRLSPETTVLLVLLLSTASEMNIFELPPVNATLNGLSTCLIATHFEELKKRYELKMRVS